MLGRIGLLHWHYWGLFWEWVFIWHTMSKSSKQRRDKILPPNVFLKKKECERCGIKSGGYYVGDHFVKGKRYKLTFHHKDGNPRNNSPDNLETLCRECHDKEHEMNN